MVRGRLLYTGKTKTIYETTANDNYIIEYRDDVAALNGLKKAKYAGKGMVNNVISSVLFQELEKNGVKTHFIEQMNDREMLVKRIGMIPLEIVVRNVAAGRFSRKYNVVEGTKLEPTVIEFSYKDDVLGDPMMNEYHILALHLTTADGLETIKKVAFRVNEVLQAFFLKHGLLLVDIKIEVGYDTNGQILVADEISQDRCRIWDVQTGEKLDKDRFREDLGGFEEAYQDVLRRLTHA